MMRAPGTQRQLAQGSGCAVCMSELCCSASLHTCKRKNDNAMVHAISFSAWRSSASKSILLGNMIAKRLMSALLLFGIATVNATTFYTRHIHLGRALQQAQRLRGGADEIGCIFDDRTERTQEEWALLKQQQSATTHSAEIFGSL
eukprot:3802-Heterococcus_DN1.PRE.1